MNITLKLDDAVIRRAKHVALDEDMSVSAWVQDLIVHQLNARDQYEKNREAALSVLKAGLSLGGKPLSREEAHAR